MSTSDLGGILLVAGAAWAVLAAVGVLKFDDIYSRLHAATKATTLALLVVLAGAALHLDGRDAAKLALVGLLVFVTAPVGAHLIGRAVHRSPGDTPIRIDTVDEFARTEEGGNGAGPTR